MIPKNIVLKLVSIAYGGKSIGNKLRIHIETLGVSLELNKILKKGTIVKINKEIGIFAADVKEFKLPLTIQVIEKDIRYDDTEKNAVTITPNLALTTIQKFTSTIRVAEMRKRSKGSEATFEFIFSVQTQDAIRYIGASEQGFLLVKTMENENLSLPSFLNVKFDYRKDKRDYFTVLEGSEKEKKFSIKLDKKSTSFLHAGNVYMDPIKAQYSKSTKILILNDKKYQTIDSPYEPWAKRLYDIEIPDAPHELGRQYLQKTSKSLVWFRIGHDGEKYIHTGQTTLGCITVLEHEKWNEIYDVLIRARKGDSKSIGTLKVID